MELKQARPGVRIVSCAARRGLDRSAQPEAAMRRLLALALLLAFCAPAAAEYPDPGAADHSVPPGGSNECRAGRRQAAFGQLGAQVFVDNRGGGAWGLGRSRRGRAADGYYAADHSRSRTRSIPRSTEADLRSDQVLAPISILATGPNVLVVDPELPGEP